MKNKKGFTLIELIMVIVILCVLAAIAIPTYMDMKKKAKRNSYNGSGIVAEAYEKNTNKLTRCENGYLFFKADRIASWQQVLGENGNGATCR